MIAATLALMTTLVVRKAREPDTVRKIARIEAKTYRLKGISKFHEDETLGSEAAFARAIALNPDEASVIKWFKLEQRLRDLIHRGFLDEALKEGDEAIAADGAALEHVIDVYTASESYLFLFRRHPPEELRKIRQHGVDLARAHDAPPELLERAVSALARVVEPTSDDSE
jgi:hypothetical protein